MTTCTLERKAAESCRINPYHDRLGKILDPTLCEFDRVLRKHAAFDLLFAWLCGTEIALFVMFFAVLAHSLVLALSLALIFFTFFSYFTLRIYFQTKKPEQFLNLREKYINFYKGSIVFEEGSADYHNALASAYWKFANRLHGREYIYYIPPSWLSFLTPWLERLSCFLHWEDVYAMKESLLTEAVNQHLNFVKSLPTSLEAHAALANAYVMLSGLYIDPRKLEGYDEERWIPKSKYDERCEKKFRFVAERAIEEFKILSEYAPDDPWVHSQLAYSYHDLQMPMEEIKEYEAIERLLPDDKDNLYKLGVLYFQQGMNAKGLRVYERLRTSSYSKAESLIKSYGAYALQDS